MRISVGMIVLVAGCIVMSGCMSTAGPEVPVTTSKTVVYTPIPQTQAPQTSVTVAVPTHIPTAPAPVNRYVSGDILRNPSSTSSASWVVINYYPDTDTYYRAVVYPEKAGAWERRDTRSDQVDRSAFEKLYTELVARNAVVYSAEVTPTISPEETVTPEPAATKTTPLPNQAFVSQSSVTIIYIDPPFASGGQYQEISVLGSGFKPDVKVVLKSVDGRQDIVSKAVFYDNENRLRVLFDIRQSTLGVYDFVVVNTDGTVGMKRSGFSIL